jgi:hypothetical protein
LMTAMVCSSCPTLVSTKYQHVLYWRHCSISWTLLSSPIPSFQLCWHQSQLELGSCSPEIQRLFRSPY